MAREDKAGERDGVILPREPRVPTEQRVQARLELGELAEVARRQGRILASHRLGELEEADIDGHGAVLCERVEVLAMTSVSLRVVEDAVVREQPARRVAARALGLVRSRADAST